MTGLRERLAVVAPAFRTQVRQICGDGRLDDMVVCPGDSVEVYTWAG